jgi:hypothetical protein
MRLLLRDFRTKRFWRWFSVQTFAAVGLFALILEVANDIAGHLPLTGWRLAVVIAVVSLGYGLARAWPRPIRQVYNAPNVQIEVVEGDLLEQDCSIVVGTCDTFDTSVPSVIAKSSVQGQVLDRLYGGDVNQLDQEITDALESLASVDTIEKPGKRAKYGIGAIATLRKASAHLYLLAYCEMNKQNQASTTPDAIWRSLGALWQEVSRTANGAFVAIPVLGGGQSRVSHMLPAQDSIRFIALSFMFACRNGKVCDGLRIVVRPVDFERLDRLELQAFLSSLKNS